MGASSSREQQSQATMSSEASSCPVVGSSVGSTPPETTATGTDGSSCPIPERFRRGPVYNVYNQRIDGAPAPPACDMHAAQMPVPPYADVHRQHPDVCCYLCYNCKAQQEQIESSLALARQGETQHAALTCRPAATASAAGHARLDQQHATGAQSAPLGGAAGAAVHTAGGVVHTKRWHSRQLAVPLATDVLQR